ncbi:MAG TPA: hypothetical protein VFS85_03260 [Dongiaceae bacterium]|jgi:hypothetical protein|nr:hypothetical protein [Dongiaceae bacterium]
MADEPIPDDLRDFILKYIDSVAHLEALLLLRANPGETWDIPRTAKRLYITEQQAGEVLGRLCADGLLSCEAEIYRCDGQSAEQKAMIDRLAQAYTRHLIAITNMIHAKPRRIREFADAFKFRKDR